MSSGQTRTGKKEQGQHSGAAAVRNATFEKARRTAKQRGNVQNAPACLGRCVAPHIKEIIQELQENGYEAYVVGGAVRDFLMGRQPKDYDLSTSATPEQIRRVFRNRRCMIIGKRFRLVHLYCGNEIIEISTFRRCPVHGTEQQTPERSRRRGIVPENMIFRDNEFGTSYDDAFRRDFTVNAIFYDPLHNELFDYTGMGIRDIEERRIRIIGEAALRFEEDPVRILRALKLKGQYGFSFEEQTEQALCRCLPLIVHASFARMTLELEKILKNPYGDAILEVFHEYGFLKHFLPFLEQHYFTPEGEYARALFALRCERLRNGDYRDSLSLAYACFSLPFYSGHHCKDGDFKNLWTEFYEDMDDDIKDCILQVFHPHTLTRRASGAAVKNLMMQPRLKNEVNLTRYRSMPGYANARELALIQNMLSWKIEGFEEKFPSAARKDHHKSRRKRSGNRRRNPAAPE